MQSVKIEPNIILSRLALKKFIKQYLQTLETTQIWLKQKQNLFTPTRLSDLAFVRILVVVSKYCSKYNSKQVSLEKMDKTVS